jgi:signal transduction histidine kinase
MNRESILIVEDSMIVSTHIRTVLDQVGYQTCKVVASGEEAIEQLEKATPDLILMDIILAGELNGIEAAAIIQAKHKIPIIYLTAMTDKRTIESAKLTGPYSYVIKPFDEKDLVTRIEIALYKNKLEAESKRTRLATLLEGQEMERQRLSRELHDGLGAILTALKINIDNSGYCDNEIFISKTIQLIDEAVEEVRRMSDNLMPPKLLDFDLATCIASLCRQVQNDHTEVIFQTGEFPAMVSEQQKLMLYRIAQECLSNASKHGECKKIFVQLYCQAPNIILTVEDDGRGFDEVAIRDGRGLKNIKYRTEVLKGTCLIESREGEGTLVSVSVPYHSL